MQFFIFAVFSLILQFSYAQEKDQILAFNFSENEPSTDVKSKSLFFSLPYLKKERTYPSSKLTVKELLHAMRVDNEDSADFRYKVNSFQLTIKEKNSRVYLFTTQQGMISSGMIDKIKNLKPGDRIFINEIKYDPEVPLQQRAFGLEIEIV